MRERFRHIERVEEPMPRERLTWDKPVLKTFPIHDTTSTMDGESGVTTDGQDAP